MKITLTNDFHNTEANLVLSDEAFEKSDTAEISESQYYRTRRKLCGIEGCTCGVTRECNYYLYADRDIYGDWRYYVIENL